VLLGRLTYTYDKVGNRTSLFENSGARTTWTYDATYRLTNEHRTGTTAHNTTHTYDPVGNRLVRQVDGALTTFTYDVANQLETSKPSTGSTSQNDYYYDGAGNLISVYDGGGGGTQTRDNTWDADNRLTSLSVYPGTDITTMTYNADGLRVKVQSPGGTLDKIWDGQTMIADSENTNAIRRYASKPTLYGDILHQWGQDPKRFYLYDALGSTIGLTDDSQDLTDSYLYKAYGEVLSSSGSTVNPFQWVGRFGYQYDKITANILQQYVRQRHYLPYTAAWISEDPLVRDLIRLGFSSDVQLAESSQRYRYLHNQPTNLIDPPGLILPIIGGASALALWCWVTPPCGPIAACLIGALGAEGIDLLLRILLGGPVAGFNEHICNILFGYALGLCANLLSSPIGAVAGPTAHFSICGAALASMCLECKRICQQGFPICPL
jgi:RHS repeat-associated protein